MINRLPEEIELKEFPRVKSHYQVSIALEKFPRLVEYVQSKTGQIALRLELSKNSAGQAIIEGHVNTEVLLQCQRCLDDYKHIIDKQFKFCVLEHEPNHSMEADIEPLIIEMGEKIPTLELIEDELMFELPLFASHPDIKDCDQTMIARITEYTEEKRSSPFEILKNLKKPE